VTGRANGPDRRYPGATITPFESGRSRSGHVPLPAAGLAYALHAAPPGVPPRTARALRAAALGVLGDGLYAAAIVLLVGLSVAVRLAERRDRA